MPDGTIERGTQWIDDKIGAALGDVTNQIAAGVEKGSDQKISASTVKSVTPYVAAGAVAATGLLLSDTTRKASKGIGKVVRMVVTGGGYLEKIPLLGKVFSGAGWLVDQASEYGGHALTAIASFLTYKMFRAKPDSPSGNPANTPNTGTGAVGQEPDFLGVKMYDPNSRKVVATEQAPLRSKPVADSDSTVKLKKEAPATTSTGYEMLAIERAKAIRDNKAELSESLRVFMQEQNQRYENRRLFLQRVEEFTATGAGRDKIIGTLSAYGLTLDEAKALAPDGIKLRRTVTMGATDKDNSVTGTGLTDFAGEYKQLEEAGIKFEKFYGKKFFPVSELQEVEKDGKKTQVKVEVRRDFEKMSVTQKHEFLEKAIEHARSRYSVLSPCVYNRYSMTYCNKGGSGGVYEIVRDFSKVKAITCHHAEGEPGKVLEPSAEYDFLSGINGNVSRSMSWESKDRISRTTGEQLDYGKQIQIVAGAFGDWSTLINEHKAMLERSETAYNGEINQYTKHMLFLDQSMEMNHRHGIAMLKVNEYGIDVRDLRRFQKGATPSSKDNIRWKGNWTDESHNTFTIRGIETEDKNVNFDKAVTVNLSTGEGVEAFLAQMDGVLKGSQTRSNIIVTQVDRNPRPPRVRVTDNTIPENPRDYWLAGRFEGNKFIATGMVDKNSYHIPTCPDSALLPLRTADNYELDGDDAVYATYTGNGRRCADVTLKGPDGSKTYLIEVGSGWRRVDIKAFYEKMPDCKKGCGPDYTIMDIPNTKVEASALGVGEIPNKDDDYARIAKIYAAHRANLVVTRENENRKKAFKDNLLPAEYFKVTPLPKEIVIENIDAIASWKPMLDQMRYKASTPTPKGALAPTDPFKTSLHMVELTDTSVNNPTGRYIAHGNFDQSTNKFVLHGFEYRPNGLPNDKAGMYRALEGNLDLEKRNLDSFFAAAAEGIKNGVFVEKLPQVEDAIIVSDYRKKELSQKLALLFKKQPDNNYKLDLWLRCDETAMKQDFGMELFCIGMKKAGTDAKKQDDTGITITEAEYKALLSGEKSADTIIDKLNTFAKNNMAVKVKKLDLATKHVEFVITDNRVAGKPATYELSGKVKDDGSGIDILKLTKDGALIKAPATIEEINNPAAWLTLIDGGAAPAPTLPAPEKKPATAPGERAAAPTDEEKKLARRRQPRKLPESPAETSLAGIAPLPAQEANGMPTQTQQTPLASKQPQPGASNSVV